MSPADAVQDADIVVTMLTDAAAVLETITAASSALPASAVWIQCSTVGEQVDDLIAFAEGNAVTFVDAPVQGTRQPAIDGNLLVICAADPALRVLVQPVFDAIGSKTLWVADSSAEHV